LLEVGLWDHLIHVISSIGSVFARESSSSHAAFLASKKVIVSLVLTGYRWFSEVEASRVQITLWALFIFTTIVSYRSLRLTFRLGLGLRLGLAHRLLSLWVPFLFLKHMSFSLFLHLLLLSLILGLSDLGEDTLHLTLV
jgi:hypothetical protein